MHAEDLQLVLDRMEGALVAEGAGGLAVPLNRTQTFADVAALAKLQVVLAVGLRLGCINHALLTAELLQSRQVPLAGAVLVDRWEDSGAEYHADVARAISQRMNILGTLPYDADEARAVQAGVAIFKSLLQTQ